MDNKEEFKPYIPPEKTEREFSYSSIMIGVLLAVVFGGANAYLGLRVGMTVSASIPAAVVSMGIIRVILKRESVLENNMAQTIGSAGESLAAGTIFTMPVLFMWAEELGEEAPSLIEIFLISLCGGLLGVLFMIPLRQALIVREHKTLPYPEGQACAKVLLAGKKGGAKAKDVFLGLGISAVYKFIADGIKVFPSELDFQIKHYKGSGFGIDILPSLVGVGYICGAKVSSYLLAGGTIGWFVIMPLIALFGGDMIIYPGKVLINEMTTWDIWSQYIRYIGAGAVMCGGILSLIKTSPIIIATLRKAFGSFGRNTETQVRTNKDIPMYILLTGVLVIALIMYLVPAIPVNFIGAVIIIVFGFFFATVSSRMVGLVGSSNNPVSGMAIATLLIATFLLKLFGTTGMSGMIAAITIGSIICIIAAIAGDASQDLKTGYILGATPYKQQIGELIGVVASAFAIGIVLYLLNSAWGYGSNELPAPQATLMKMVVEGVMGGNLPWSLVFIGIFVALVAEILQVPVLPFAVGLYLPIHLSTPIMVGGLIRYFFDNKKEKNQDIRNEKVERGILYSSGLIAGEGIIGILLAVMAIIPIKNGNFSDLIDLSSVLNSGTVGGIIFFALFILSFILIVNKNTQ